MKPASTARILALAAPLACSLNVEPFEPPPAEPSRVESPLQPEDPLQPEERTARTEAERAFVGRELLELNADIGGDIWAARLGGDLSVTSEAFQSGTESWLLQGRVSDDDGIWREVTPLVGPGGTYQVVGFARLRGAESDKLELKVQLNCGGAEGMIIPVVTDTVGSDARWTRLSGEFTVPGRAECAATSIGLEVAGPAAGVDLLVDSLSMRAVAPVNLVANPGCETDATGWSPFASMREAESTSAAPAFAGERSCSSGQERTTGTFEGLYYNLSDHLINGAPFFARAAVRHAGPGTQPLFLKLRLDCVSSQDGDIESEDQYFEFRRNIEAPANQWEVFEGEVPLRFADVCVPDALHLFLEGPEVGIEVFLDDVYVGLDAPLARDE